MTEGTCFIGKLIVHPEFQNQGIGTKLLKEIEYHFNSAKRFELFTGIKSEKNLYLYRKHGFEIFKREQVNEALTLVFMEKQAQLNYEQDRNVIEIVLSEGSVDIGGIDAIILLSMK